MATKRPLLEGPRGPGDCIFTFFSLFSWSQNGAQDGPRRAPDNTGRQNRAKIKPEWSQICFPMRPRTTPEANTGPPTPPENSLDQPGPPASPENSFYLHWATSSTGKQLVTALSHQLHRKTACTSIGPPAPRQPTNSTFETTALKASAFRFIYGRFRAWLGPLGEARML